MQRRPVDSLYRQAQARSDRSGLSVLRGRLTLDSLLDGTEGTAEHPGVERLRTRAEISYAMAQLGSAVSTELIGLLPNSPDPAASLASSRTIDLELLDRGVAMYLIYESGWTSDRGAVEGIRTLVAAGATARVIDRVPHRLIVCDRSVAMVPIDLAGRSTGAVMVHERAIVSSLRALFTGIWQRATDIGTYDPERAPTTAPHDRQLLELMSVGITDETAARRMDVSVRTYRRYVADLMHRLGARSRFQAGVTAVQRGWL